MGNLADAIERFILRKLAAGNGGIIVVRRSEIAEEIACAPSQVTYVLGTRFTMDRGFIVESRRGSGGFVRIAKLALPLLPEMPAPQEEALLPQEASHRVVHWERCGLLSEREGAVVQFFLEALEAKVDDEERGRLLRGLMHRLADLPRREGC